MEQQTKYKQREIEAYNPNEKKRADIQFVYKELQLMIDERNKPFRQFNDRTLIQFIDDSEKRVQGYVPPRESQGKDENQANVFNQVTRNKLKAIIASVASTPPVIKYKAVNLNDGSVDLRRAEIIENLVQYSRYRQNPEIEIFWEAWECACKGTVVKYDGYLNTKAKRKFIKSYDFITGEMEFEEREVVIKDECIDELVPLNELYIKDFFEHDIQKQPAIAWVRYVDEQTAEAEWGNHKDWKYVPTRSATRQVEGSQQTFMSDQWESRVEENEYEIVKYYNIFKDIYIVVINGVLMKSSPMLWGRTDKKYPFSKTIFEPFSGRDFFYGNSLANANMDAQDTINAFYNMAIDKTKRSLNPPLLLGAGNRDLMDLEDEYTGMETKIYLQDVNQAKYQDIPGLNNSELAMIKWVSSGIDLGTVDENQQGVASRGTTAREIVIANENAKRLKGLFFMFLTDLWVQKTKIRILNVLTHYTTPKVKEVIGENGASEYEEIWRTFTVENSEFPDGTKGTLAIQILGEKEKMPKQNDVDVEEEYGKLKTGNHYQKVYLKSTYLDDYEYDVQVIPDSIFQKDSAEAQAVVEQKLKVIATMFPEKFMANQDILFEDFITAYNESPEKYMGLAPQPEPMAEEMPTEGTQQPTKGELPPLPPNTAQQPATGSNELLELRDTINKLNQ